jgi:hypothetical protein
MNTRFSASSWLLLAGLAALAVPLHSEPASSPGYPLPTPPKDDSQLGAGVQRTMRLLATSTPEHHNHVRILFYGQSITEQDWSKRVADDLRRRFPNADLEIENRAIGGFASQLLIRPAEHDLYPFYPDLLIFHVYGANQEYEQIIKNVRSRTTAEVLMQRDHLTQWPAEHPDPNVDKGLWWDHMMNDVFLPDIAKKYGCGLADVRGGWLDYLKANHLEPPALLKDGVHLNDHGNFLMAELVKRALVYRPGLSRPVDEEAIRTLAVGKDVQWKSRRLALEFEGNRVDALLGPKNGAGPVRVRIDGKKPSEFPELYRITRPSPGPWSPLFVSRVDHPAPLVPEEWTLKITSVSEDGKKWSFDVKGSVTGPDGSGTNDAVFVSPSGRVKIEPAAFFRNDRLPLAAGYEITWKVLPTHVDAFTPAAPADPARENAVTLAQGLANTRHTLELTMEGGNPPPVQAIRVYRPPVR